LLLVDLEPFFRFQQQAANGASNDGDYHRLKSEKEDKKKKKEDAGSGSSTTYVKSQDPKTKRRNPFFKA
jgi:hypothetical protein